MSTRLLTTAACFLIAAPPGDAQDLGSRAGTSGTPSLVAARALTPPMIDGSNADAIWGNAEARSDFVTFQPREGGAPSFRTELRVAYDDRALYILVRAYDPHPDSIVRLLSRRDTDGAPNDQLQLWIDSFNDHRSGFEYIVNAAGVKSDYLIFDDTGFDQSWDGVWDVATRVDSLGWLAEYAIPLQELRFNDRDAPVFGIMLWRLVGRRGERVSWPAYRPSRSGYMSQTGRLDGIRDLVRPVSLVAIPYALGRTRNAPTAAGADRHGRTDATIGGDVRFVPVPNVGIDATINPDFGQVESDPAVLDLTGFEVFQAERRPFFLEGAGQLHFPLAQDASAVLFHSRRIGRAPTLAPAFGGADPPTETTIHGAAKVVARFSPATSLVVLSATTAEETGAPGERGVAHVLEPPAYYGVARLQHDFRRGRSGIGAMLTRVDRARGDSVTATAMLTMAQAIALTTQHQTFDGNFRVSGWLGSSDVRGSREAIGVLQRSPVHGFQRPDDDVELDLTRRRLRGSAGQFFAGKVAGGVTRYDVSYRWISPEFDVNEVGFLTRSGVRNLAANAGLRATRAGTAFGIPYRSAALMFGFSGAWESSGLAAGRALSVTANMQLNNLALVQGSVAQELPGAFCSLTCTRGGPALVDEPRTTLSADVTGDPRRRLIPHANVSWSRDDLGRSRSLATQADVVWRARTNLDLSLAANAQNATHDAFFFRRVGDVLSDTARILLARLDQPMRSLTARIDYTMTTTLSAQWYAQAFVSRGGFTNLRELADPRAERYDERFDPVNDTSITSSVVGVDFRQFRSNVVVRWEYRPGSTLFFVWTQGRDVSSTDPGTLRLGSDLRGLFRTRPLNVLAVKASYWFSR
jgi:hypothetical protein